MTKNKSILIKPTTKLLTSKITYPNKKQIKDVFVKVDGVRVI